MDLAKTKNILFLGEQDGVAECDLKAEIAKCFTQDMQVISAYLVRVSYGELPGPQVALCLRGSEEKAQTLLQCVGKAFSKLFNTTQHLDIVFMSEAQLKEIERIAKPFYLSAVSARTDKMGG